MKQWMLEQKMVALNTMYKKAPQKQCTYRTPNGVEKQLYYILVKKKQYRWSRYVEANDMIHMGSDHRSVLARFASEKPMKKNEFVKGQNTKSKQKKDWGRKQNMDLKQDTKTLRRRSKRQNRR